VETAATGPHRCRSPCSFNACLRFRTRRRTEDIEADPDSLGPALVPGLIGALNDQDPLIAYDAARRPGTLQD